MIEIRQDSLKSKGGEDDDGGLDGAGSTNASLKGMTEEQWDLKHTEWRLIGSERAGKKMVGLE